jgi:Tol biopolymer transport system component/DNA-binding winged helix-turn-helix (wHTH) protein
MINLGSGENQGSVFSRGIMSLPFKQLYEFGEFRLDVREKILMQAGRPVELTPKGFELLSVFVENHGRLLEKDELMDRIWADSFVEESNLTFNIRQLRKTLGDDAHDPKYIKTVRRHGYRFIADVREISDEHKEASEPAAPEALQPAKTVRVETAAALPETRKSFSPLRLTSLILMVAAMLFGAWYVKSNGFQPKVPVLAAPFASEKLSTNGKVVHARLSPDGKNVIYINGKGGDKQSVWIRQIENGNNVEIIPPSDDIYKGLTISPDGNLLYFVRNPRLTSEPANIYRVSIFGGIPQKILGETEGWTSISPDGALISFVRCPRTEEEECSLWVADAADGKNERKLVTRPRPFRIGDNRFAPDGKTIAFAAGQSENSGNDFGLSEVDLETGKERELTSEKFFNIKNLAWLPDKSGWLLTASRVPNINVRIWQVDARGGKAVPLTKDSESYGILSLDKAATKIVSTQIKQSFQMRLCQTENPSACKVLADAGVASIAPDGKIFFASNMSGSGEIWSINADGNQLRQLTNDRADLSKPVVSPDNNSVFFGSNRSGAAQVWRMNPDGSEQRQITREVGGYPLSVSPDGEWVYYLHGINRMLWRVSTKGDTEELVLNKAKSFFAISPDGRQAAFSEPQGDQRILTIVSLGDGQIVKTFNLAEKKTLLLSVAWLPDGKNLLYVSSNFDHEKNALWIQPLGEEKPRRIAALGDEEVRGGISLSADGKSFTIVQGKWMHDAVVFKGLR